MYMRCLLCVNISLNLIMFTIDVFLLLKVTSKLYLHYRIIIFMRYTRNNYYVYSRFHPLYHVLCVARGNPREQNDALHYIDIDMNRRDPPALLVNYTYICHALKLT